MRSNPDSKCGASCSPVYHGGMSSASGQPPGEPARGSIEPSLKFDPPARWSKAQFEAAQAVSAVLADAIPGDDFVAVGLAGAPGTGKSSLTRMVAHHLEAAGSPTLVLSLDDYYLGKAARQNLALRHALFRQRGVPGTHDWTGLLADLDQLRAGNIEGLRLRRFDKQADDCAHRDTFRRVCAQPRVCLLEGWPIGAPPQPANELADAVNAMEAEHDPDGAWRTLVNDHLARYHRDLETRLAQRWYLRVPGWEAMVEWRWQQEQEGPGVQERPGGQATHLQSRADVEQFLRPFQRIVTHMQDTAPRWADRIITIDNNHLLSLD